MWTGRGEAPAGRGALFGRAGSPEKQNSRVTGAAGLTQTFEARLSQSPTIRNVTAAALGGEAGPGHHPAGGLPPVTLTPPLGPKAPSGSPPPWRKISGHRHSGCGHLPPCCPGGGDPVPGAPHPHASSRAVSGMRASLRAWGRAAWHAIAPKRKVRPGRWPPQTSCVGGSWKSALGPRFHGDLSSPLGHLCPPASWRLRRQPGPQPAVDPASSPVRATRPTPRPARGPQAACPPARGAFSLRGAPHPPGSAAGASLAPGGAVSPASPRWAESLTLPNPSPAPCWERCPARPVSPLRAGQVPTSRGDRPR